MSEEETVFSSKVKYEGIFSLKNFYKFCYEWLTDEVGLDIEESKYKEKLVGDSKNVEIQWKGKKKITDYFQFYIKVDYQVLGLKKTEVIQNGVKVSTNTGSVQVKVKGILIRDYDGKFERTSRRKFMRGIYEKWVIPARIEEFEERLISKCDEFLNQAKAYLDLEGQK